MLVLTRQQNQSILIDGDIRVTIIRVKGDRVRVGIEAPRSTNVIREELCTQGVVLHDPEHGVSGPLAEEAVCHAAGITGVHGEGTGDPRRTA